MTERHKSRYGKRRRRRKSTRFSTPEFSLSRLHSFATLVSIWLKHWFLDTIRPVRRQNRRDQSTRERIYVDASFKVNEDGGETGIGGIGVWIPRRRIAIALKVNVRSSMEAEILALMAGVLAAEKLGIDRPNILSDCKSAVRTGTRLLNLESLRGPLHKLVCLAEVSHEHRAFRYVYNSLQRLRGTLEWQPREQNREADLASNIGSRVGNMGILLSGAKNRNHALNDVLSRALASHFDEAEEETTKMVRRSYHRGSTRTVRYQPGRVPSSRAFMRKAPRLIAKLSAEVA